MTIRERGMSTPRTSSAIQDVERRFQFNREASVKTIEAEGITLDEPVRKTSTGNTITYITDPWGTRIEIVQLAPLGEPVQ
jgi:hypothetical protein